MVSRAYVRLMKPEYKGEGGGWSFGEAEDWQGLPWLPVARLGRKVCWALLKCLIWTQVEECPCTSGFITTWWRGCRMPGSGANWLQLRKPEIPFLKTRKA